MVCAKCIGIPVPDVIADIAASNGVAYVIDSVLLPSARGEV